MQQIKILCAHSTHSDGIHTAVGKPIPSSGLLVWNSNILKFQIWKPQDDSDMVSLIGSSTRHIFVADWEGTTSCLVGSRCGCVGAHAGEKEHKAGGITMTLADLL